MNYRIIFHTTGKVLLVEAGLLALPLLVSVLYHERCAWAVLASMAAAAVIGGLLTLLARPRCHTFFNREGYIIVALAWVLLSAVGALPFWFSREIPSYADAFFETVSGFTTTGASILTDVEAMSHGLLFWRSFTHWVGGMGVLVFITMISGSSDRSMNILKAEMPGPVVGKLTPRTRDTARVLYLLYFLITTVLVGMLLLGGMPLFDSLVHAFGTVGTGGFGIKNDSIAGYSTYCQVIITIFMILFGINFNAYFLILIRKFRQAWESEEVRAYLLIIAAATLAITFNVRGYFSSFAQAFQQTIFQVASIITTTGYATTNFDLWPEFSRTILVLLMFVGACAGSTGGGIKVSRILILLKTVKKELIQLLHPRSVRRIQIDGKAIEHEVVRSTNVYMGVYIFIFAFSMLLIALNNFDLITNFSAVAATLNNIGPGLSLVGPIGNFSMFSDFSKLVLIFDMLAGRLELFPLLLLFVPNTWKRF